MKKFSEVAHLYIGCEVEFEFEGRKKIGKLVSKIEPFGWQVFDPSNVSVLYHNVKGELIKPILRPLSDITEEEMNECGNLVYDFSSDPELNKWEWNDFETQLDPEQFVYLLSRSFDLFGLIESGQAIDKTKKSL